MPSKTMEVKKPTQKQLASEQASGRTLMPGVGTLVGAIAGGVIDRMANPNPEAYLDDTEKIIVEGSGEESHDPDGRWFPTKSDKWLSSYQPGATDDDGRNLFNSNEDDHQRRFLESWHEHLR